MRLRAAICVLAVAITTVFPDAHATEPERVTFASQDGKTTLIGYVFKSEPMPEARVPAIVMMHGRAGAYSTQAKGIYDASTLSQRHRFWGQLWAKTGYIAILVDGFGPRGHATGFPRFSYQDRPAEVDEVTVRPLDAYGALAYLRTRTDVLGDRIALQGWSNGASATLSAMSVDTPARQAASQLSFRAAIAFYPACGLKGHFDEGFRPYAPVQIFHGSADEEVSPTRCRRFVQASRAIGGDISVRIYDGATHGFDDPGQRRQRIRANTEAAEDAVRRAQRFVSRLLRDKDGNGLR